MNLKPKQSEISSAKLIWRATNDEQTLRYEIEIFKNWLNFKQNNQCCYTFEQLQLPNIKTILNTLTYAEKQKDTSLSQDMYQQIMPIAIQNANTYATKVERYKNNLRHNTDAIQPCYHQITKAIEERERNMIERAHYHTHKKLQMVFPINTNEPN